MNDQTNKIEKAAAAFLRGALPGVPGSFLGDQAIKPDELEKAWYVGAEADSAALLGRQTVKLTLFARSAARLDKQGEAAEALAESLRALAESEEFAEALGECAILPRPDGSYTCDDKFHTVSVTYNIFIRG